MKELKITPIKNGTVIDHIRPGMALKVIKYLGINGGTGNEVAIAMYTNSKKLGRKDLVKVEQMELGPQEVNKLALLSPNASVSIIRDFKVVKKYNVQLPLKVEGIAKCENLNCITNHREPVKSHMVRVSEDPPVYRCFYCGRNQEDITRNLL